LFSALLPARGTAVLNADDARFAQLKAMCEGRGQTVIGFGKQGVEFRIVSLAPLPHGQRVEVELLGQRHVLDIPLVGAFQTMNILAALGLVVGSGGALDKALAVIPQLNGVPGRLEQVVRLDNGATVFIDYAHTPMALANILQTLRPHALGRLHVVFGCGGDRDPGKRPQMGAIADTLADVVIVTDDNPRSEDPGFIRKAIMAATKRAKEVADRRQAIYVALKALAPEDILVIAGKGHEKTQIIGNNIHPFDDADVARQVARELKLAA
jgi:UDP-N-acetylmuramoyl-L-alanyl-D-glutamate--2,6-diaminopimelate ligase